MTQVRTRRFLPLVLALAIVLGCFSGLGLAAAAEEKVTLTVWGWNAGSIETIFDAYVKMTGANVELNYVTVQQMEAFQKLQTTISAGLEMPDIVPTEINQRGTMMSLDIWEDLSKAPYNFDASTGMFPYFVPLCTNERGELVCLPWDMSTAALAYKKDLAKQYLGTDDPAELEKLLPDWDAFAELGAKINKDTDGKVFMFASLTNVKQIIDGQNPSPIIENNVLDLEGSVRKTVSRMVQFRDNKVVDNIIESSPAYSASYADDTHIFYPCASWSPNYVIGPNDPDGIDSWGLMIPPEGCFSWGGSGHMIPKDAKHKQEAFDFISWLISTEGTISQYETVQFNISGPGAYQDPEFAKLYNDHFGTQNLGEILFVKAMENIKVRPVSVYDVTINEAWNLVVEAVNNDSSLGVDGAVDLFETELRNKIDDLQ